MVITYIYCENSVWDWDKSGYGHSGYGDHYASHSGYSDSGYSEPCCPLVIDPLLLAALLGAIAAAAYFLRSKILYILKFNINKDIYFNLFKT